MKSLSSGLVTLVVSGVLGASTTGESWQQEMDLGRTLFSHGRYAAACDLFERARREAELFGPDDARLAIVLNNLGATYLHLDDIFRAERCYRRAVEIWEARGDIINALAPLTNLAGTQLRRGQYRAAEASLSDALELATRRLGLDHPQTATILLYLADSASMRADYTRASAFGERALQAVRKRYGSADPATATAADALGTIYRAQGRNEESARLFTEAIGILEKSGQPAHPAWIRALEAYSCVFFDHGDYKKADTMLLRSLNMAEEMLGVNHPEVARILRDRALVLRKSGRKSEAKKLEARAASIQQQSNKENGIGATVDLGDLSGFRAVENQRQSEIDSGFGSALDFRSPAGFYQRPALNRP